MKSYFLIIVLSLYFSMENISCMSAANIQNDREVDLLEKPDVINEFDLDLFKIKDSRIKKILNQGIIQLNFDSIPGDYYEITVCDCNHGTIVRIEKKDWSSQADNCSLILGYSIFNGHILIIKGATSSRYFRKSKEHKTIHVRQFEPTDLKDYNPPIFLLPRTEYLRITTWGQLVPVIKQIEVSKND